MIIVSKVIQVFIIQYAMFLLINNDGMDVNRQQEGYIWRNNISSNDFDCRQKKHFFSYDTLSTGHNLSSNATYNLGIISYF